MKINKVGISDSVLKLFQNYWWPGNLRELEQVIFVMKDGIVYKGPGARPGD